MTKLSSGLLGMFILVLVLVGFPLAQDSVGCDYPSSQQQDTKTPPKK